MHKLNLRRWKGRTKFSPPTCSQRSINNGTIKMPKNILGIIQYSEVKKTHKKRKPKALRGIR